MKNTIEKLRERMIVTAEGCWIWAGQTHDGYGYASWNGRRGRVHRLMFEQIIGAIPDGMHLDHLCRQRACANPHHLEPVTPGENLRRSPLVPLNNGNALKSECAQGHLFDEANTYWRPEGGRTCRTCNRNSASRTQRVRLDRMIDGRWEA